MAVVVIPQMKDPRAVHRTFCQNCAAVLEYTRQDLHERQSRDYTGDLDVYRVIVCPACSKDVRVSNV